LVFLFMRLAKWHVDKKAYEPNDAAPTNTPVTESYVRAVNEEGYNIDLAH